MTDKYSLAELITERYSSQGAHAENIGRVIEVYPDGAYEVEFCDKNGISFAQIVAQEDELQTA